MNNAQVLKAVEITYATTNPGKIASLQRHLAPYGITVLQNPLDIPEPRSSDVQEIAQKKVDFVYNILQRPVVVLDAGFYIPSLNGFPRAFVNFVLETVDLDGIVRLVEGKDRSCEFRECLAYADNAHVKYFFGHVRGKIAEKPRGTLQPHHWSRLALIFIPDGYEKMLGEMTYEEYVKWSESVKEYDSAGYHFGKWFSTRH